MPAIAGSRGGDRRARCACTRIGGRHWTVKALRIRDRLGQHVKPTLRNGMIAHPAPRTPRVCAHSHRVVRRPNAYPHRVGQVRSIETHSSVVYLAGTFASHVPRARAGPRFAFESARERRPRHDAAGGTSLPLPWIAAEADSGRLAASTRFSIDTRSAQVGHVSDEVDRERRTPQPAC